MSAGDRCEVAAGVCRRTVFSRAGWFAKRRSQVVGRHERSAEMRNT
ncbi:hypothetical protein HMPREF3150_04647 [Pseudomonas aeruginosa]|nr:hypothetical protein HMPREF3150_04647 [Pseudomonas aeruginosa]